MQSLDAIWISPVYNFAIPGVVKTWSTGLAVPLTCQKLSIGPSALQDKIVTWFLIVMRTE